VAAYLPMPGIHIPILMSTFIGDFRLSQVFRGLDLRHVHRQFQARAILSRVVAC